MTNFRITPKKSVFTTNAKAFNGDSLDADSLTVDSGAFLIAQSIGGVGAYLANTGAWTVNVNGSIVADDASGGGSVGLALLAGNTELSTITVGGNGEISGNTDGIAAQSRVTINNFGTITATESDGTGVTMTGSGVNTLINAGTISGGRFSILGGLGDEKVTNSGILRGEVYLDAGKDQFTNSGQIIGSTFSVNLAAGDDQFTNSGLIDLGIFSVDLGGGTNVLVNTGTIKSYIYGDSDSDTMVNSGVIDDGIELGGGADVFTNFRVVNGVRINGTVTGLIELDGGADRFEGGANSETVENSGNGADIIRLREGNDTYLAFYASPDDSTDRIDGGLGFDIYDATFSANRVAINLDSVAHGSGANFVAANTASGLNVAGAKTDQITGFENAFGGMAGDLIYGSAGGNRIDGLDGSDVLFGFDGNDRLVGGASLDTLAGGFGRDILTGGTDADTFVFAGFGSGITAATRDVITDFEDTLDRIDLSGIDAVRGTAANDAFTFIGTNVAFGGQAGELRAYWTARGQVVEGDLNGDGKADFSVALNDAGHNVVLTGADFLL